MAAMLIPLSAVCFSCTKTDSSSSESSIESSESYKEFEKAAPSNSAGNGFSSFFISYSFTYYAYK